MARDRIAEVATELAVRREALSAVRREALLAAIVVGVAAVTWLRACSAFSALAVRRLVRRPW